MFLVGLENSTRSCSGNSSGIDVSLHKGTILKVMLPKIKSSKYIQGVKGAVCGPRGTHLAGRCVPVKTWEMPFIPAKSEACMSTP